jgi:heterodisulfide reductase subunit C
MIGVRRLLPGGPRPAVDSRAETVQETRTVTGRFLHRDVLKRRALVSAIVVAEPIRCVECGICTYNCPLGIDVRTHVREGRPVADSHCLTCGECVARCPRGTLRFEVSSLFSVGSTVRDG